MRPRRVAPRAGQESVWDYPRPPRVERVTKAIEIEHAGRVIARTADAVRVLETSHPPVYYLPRAAFEPGVLTPADGQSWCEFKGAASYLTVDGEEAAAWFYPRPNRGYEALVDHVAVYPGRMQRCTVGGIVVTPQAGDFYGGWITPDIVGPFKGELGTANW